MPSFVSNHTFLYIMKFHLPKKLFVAVMAAVISTQAFAADIKCELDTTTATKVTLSNGQTITTKGTTTITVGSGDYSSYNMYQSGSTNAKNGHIIGSTHMEESGVLNTQTSGPDTLYTENNIVIGSLTDTEETAPTGIDTVVGDGDTVNGVIGDRNITVNSGDIKTIVGGTNYIQYNSRNLDFIENKLGANMYSYKDSANPADVNITVNGGNIGQIRGGNNNKHADYVANVCNNAQQKNDGSYEALMADKPWSISGDVNITVTGGTIDPAKVKRTIAILGAGGSGHSVDGTVTITVTGSSTNILGDIIAGGSNSYAEVGATAVEIAGGYIDGSVYGGGLRDEAATSVKGKVAPTVLGSTKVTLSGGTITGNVYGAGIADKVDNGTQVILSAGGAAVDGTIYGGGTDDAIVTGTRTLTVDSSYTGTQAYKVADFTNIAVNADATLAEMTAAKDGTDISIAEGKTLKLTGDKTYTAGNADGGTIYVDGASLELSSADSKLTSAVVLDNHAALDLKGAAVSNTITVYGCSIAGAGSFTGHLVVDGGNLELTEATSADKVTVTNGGSVTGASLAANKVELIGSNDGATQPDIATNLAVTDNGTITLSGGAVLNVEGSLTLGSGVNIVVSEAYAAGTEIIKVSGGINQAENVEITFGNTRVLIQNGSVWLLARFNQDYADSFTMGNWGIATASRAFVNTVRGQRSNSGCIANGRGTAWVSLLGGSNDINGSDIDISGAALGADMQVGATSRVGIAMGYVEGEVQPTGLRQIDQEGSYIAMYGEHGLKKLSPTSCLSMDWVATYGITDSEVNGISWEQDSVQLNSRVNWNKKMTDKLCMSVFGGLEYLATDSDTVNGMKTGSVQNLRGEIGVGARYVAWGTPAVTDGKSGLVLAQGCEKLVLNGEIRYMNDMVRSNPVIRMDGMSGGSSNPGRQGMGIEAGATYRFGARWSASANYGYNTMEDSKEHRVNVGAAYTF